MMNKTEITIFGFFFLSLSIAIISGKYPQKYLQYRAERYEFCKKHKAEIIAENKQTKLSSGGNLGNFKTSNKPPKLVENANINHPCAWLNSYYKLRDKSISLTGR